MDDPTANILISSSTRGYTETGEYRVPEKGELYMYPNYDGTGRGAILRSGGHISKLFMIVRSESAGPRRRLTVRPGPGARINGLPAKDFGASSVIVSGDFDCEVEDLDRHVQVRYASGGVLYTYRDPSGTLEIGDLVEVPVTYGTKVGTVKALGRGSWDGPVKDVAARLSRETL